VFLYRPLVQNAPGEGDPGANAMLIGGLIGGGAGFLIGLTYASLIIFFMTRPRVVAAFRGEAFVEEPPPRPLTKPGQEPDPYTPPASRVLRPESADGSDEVVARVIPYRNKPALVGYYLGLFSILGVFPLIGVVGVGLAIAALVLGIKGLRLAADRPEARGRVHAWVAIVCGSLFGLLGLAVNGLILVTMLSS
jgi:hypothetical protein